MARRPLPPRFDRLGGRLSEALGSLADGSHTLRASLLFAGWLFVGGSGVLARMPVLPSLVLAAVSILAFAGLFLWLRRLQEQDDQTFGGRMLLILASALTYLVGGLLLIVPSAIYLVLGLWFLVSLPLWLLR